MWAWARLALPAASATALHLQQLLLQSVYPRRLVIPVAICGVASTHNGVSISVVRYVQRPVEILSIQRAKSLDSTSPSKFE